MSTVLRKGRDSGWMHLGVSPYTVIASRNEAISLVSRKRLFLGENMTVGVEAIPVLLIEEIASPPAAAGMARNDTTPPLDTRLCGYENTENKTPGRKPRRSLMVS